MNSKPPTLGGRESGIMGEALGAKFTQSPRLEELLLIPGDAELVEYTNYDRYWADGDDGVGKNRRPPSDGTSGSIAMKTLSLAR